MSSCLSPRFRNAALTSLVLAGWLLTLSCLHGPSGADPAPARYPKQVLIIRHAEKPPEDDPSVHLSPRGQQRAQALPELFNVSGTRPEPFPTPDFVFAARNSGQSHRSVETVQPLAKALKLTINRDYS